MSKVPWVFIARKPKYSFSKIKFSFPTTIPSWLIYFLIYGGVFYIYIGGVYNALENPIAFASDAQNNIAFISKGLDRQFLLEVLLQVYLCSLEHLDSIYSKMLQKITMTVQNSIIKVFQVG